MTTTRRHNIFKMMAIPAAAACFAAPAMIFAEEEPASLEIAETTDTLEAVEIIEAEPRIVEVPGAPVENATLAFDPNGGTMESESFVADAANNQVVLSDPQYVPVREDYQFANWTDESGQAVTEDILTVDRDMTLTAWWNVLLTFDWGEDSAKVPFTPGETVDLSILQPPLNRPNFAGWLNANGDLIGDAYLVNLPETFYASWFAELETSDPFEGQETPADTVSWTAPVWTDYGTYAAYTTNDGYVVINSAAGAGVDAGQTVENVNADKTEIREAVVKIPTAQSGEKIDASTWKVEPATDEKTDISEPEAQSATQSTLAWIAAAAGLAIIGAAIYKKTRRD